MKNDDFGNRMKEYEGKEADRSLIPLLPVCIRLDGKCFSKFTKGLYRPYDQRLSTIMIDLTKILVEETNATIGYTQSDEISLILHSDKYESQIWFDGRIMKISSVLSAIASVKFNELKRDKLPEKKDNLAYFDCRVWNVPNKTEASNTLLWREQDATKNSVSMAARNYFSHKDLQDKNRSEMMDMMLEKGINWDDYPSFFKRGTFTQRKDVVRKFTSEELKDLPKNHEAIKNPNLTIKRRETKVIEMPPFGTVTNRNGVVFNGENPITNINMKSMEIL